MDPQLNAELNALIGINTDLDKDIANINALDLDKEDHLAEMDAVFALLALEDHIDACDAAFALMGKQKQD
jgi:hypothetical protein